MSRIIIHVHDRNGPSHTVDLGEFEEGKHPRDPDGKFAGGAYGGTKGPAYTHPALQKTLTEHGYKKEKGTPKEHTATFANPAGHKVTIHYPKGESPSATGFTSHPPSSQFSGPKKGSGAKELGSLLSSLGARSGGTVAQAQTIAAKMDQGGVTNLINSGYKIAKLQTESGGTIMQKGASLVTVEPDGTWVASAKGHLPKTGSGKESLNALLAGGLAPVGSGGWKNVGMHELPAEHAMNNTYGSYDPAQIEKVKAEQAAAAAEQAAVMQKHAEAKKAEEAKHAQLIEHMKKGGSYNGKALNIAMQASGGKEYAQFVSHTPDPSPSQSNGIKTYTGSSYKAINQVMRSESIDKSQYAPMIKDVTNYLNKSKTTAPTILYRGVDPGHGDSMASVIYPGATFMEKGFMSTSTSRPFANSWRGGDGQGVLFELETPAGTAAAAVTHIGVAGEHESEVLVQRRRVIQVTHWDPHLKVAKGRIINLPDEEHL